MQICTAYTANNVANTYSLLATHIIVSSALHLPLWCLSILSTSLQVLQAFLGTQLHVIYVIWASSSHIILYHTYLT